MYLFILGRNPLHERPDRRRDLYLTTHNTYNTDIHAPGGNRTHYPSKRAAAGTRLRPRDQSDLDLYSGVSKRAFVRLMKE